MSPVVPPCKDCENRSVACHGSCEEYKNYTLKLEEVKRAKKAFRFDPTANFAYRKTRAIKNGRVKR